MPNVMAALPNIGGHTISDVQKRDEQTDRQTDRQKKLNVFGCPGGG